MQVQPRGGDDPLENEMATLSRILAWRILWTEEPGRLQCIELQRVRHVCSELACTHINWLFTFDSLCDQHAHCSQKRTFYHLCSMSSLPLQLYHSYWLNVTTRAPT